MAGPTSRTACAVAADDEALLVACPGGLSEHDARIRWETFDEIKCVGAVIVYHLKYKPLLRVELDSTADAEALAEASLNAKGELPDAERNLGPALSQVLLVTSNEVRGMR